jgi:leucyl-tRNA synthetase
LANEEVIDGVCERCGSVVEHKNKSQWMLKITAYAERLLDDLQGLDWPEKVKKMQTEWIGKSYGAEIDFGVSGSELSIKVFTTRPDTLYGATFMVLSPEHTLVKQLTTDEYAADMDAYCRQAAAKSSVDRMTSHEKTGVFTGSYGVNPLNNEKVPIWVSDYVLADYGTGAIMCVPAHDERDFDFAQKFHLPIIQVISSDGKPAQKLSEAYVGDGVMINSGDFNGIKSAEAKATVPDYLEKQGIGHKTINYKLRDWVFSRQRYWGEPIPIVHCPHCGAVAVPEEDLPVLLPEVESYQPTDTGESPLAKIDSWVNITCPKCGGPAKRETNTMPQWAGSSWYFLRYADPHNDKELASKEALEKWLPVDYYVGGVEHAVLHLLYARFYTKFLYDIGVVGFQEPFTKLFNQGMITNQGHKMDKSGDNYVSPDAIVDKYGCDSLRMYELFIGPPELDSEWDERSIDGVNRYLNRVWRLITENYPNAVDSNKQLEQARNKMVYEITSRLEHWSLNTVVSGFMEFTNKLSELAKQCGGLDKQTMESLIIMLAPFVPHISAELWETTGHGDSLFDQKWPSYDAGKLKEDSVTLAVQVNGKLRDSITVPAETDKSGALEAAKAALGSRLDTEHLVREVYVPGRIVNFVVK